jgi:hypothetical protein
MAICVNNTCVSAMYSTRLLTSYISSECATKLSVFGNESGQAEIQLVVSALASPQIVGISLIVGIDCNLKKSDILLGKDWYDACFPALSGLSVQLLDCVLTFPVSFALHSWRPHQADNGFESDCSDVKSVGGVSNSGPSRVSAGAAPSTSVPLTGVYLIEEAFVGHCGSGARTSVFSDSLSAMRAVMQMHGIDFSDHSLPSCRAAVIRHYVSGHCYDNACSIGQRIRSRRHNHHESLNEVSTCANVCQRVERL